MPCLSGFELYSRWVPLKNCGVQVIPGMKSYQMRFKQGGKKMSKYSTNFSSGNSKKTEAR